MKEAHNAESVAGYCPCGEPYDDKDSCPHDPVRPADTVRGNCDYTVDGHHVPVVEQHGFWPWQRHTECWLCERLIDG